MLATQAVAPKRINWGDGLSDSKDNVRQIHQDKEPVENPTDIKEQDLPKNVFPYSHFRLRQFSEEVKRQLPKELWDNPPDADKNEKIRKALNKQRPITEMIKWNKATDKQKTKGKIKPAKDDEDA